MTSARELLRSSRRAPADDDIASGMIEGLTGAGPGRLESRPDESRPRSTARLVGRFVVWVESTGRTMEDSLLSVATPYLSMVVASIADDDWDPALRDPAALLRMHTIAMMYVERHAGAPTPVAHENLLVAWLTAQAALRPTDDAGAVLGRIRRRRHEKLFGPGSTTDGDPGR